MLLEHGANLRKDSDISKIDVYHYHRHVEMLLEHGANLRKDRTGDGSTAAYYAARSGSFEVVIHWIP